jgi:hypothetical protein
VHKLQEASNSILLLEEAGIPIPALLGTVFSKEQHHLLKQKSPSSPAEIALREALGVTKSGDYTRLRILLNGKKEKRILKRLEHLASRNLLPTPSAKVVSEKSFDHGRGRVIMRIVDRFGSKRARGFSQWCSNQLGVEVEDSISSSNQQTSVECGHIALGCVRVFLERAENEAWMTYGIANSDTNQEFESQISADGGVVKRVNRLLENGFGPKSHSLKETEIKRVLGKLYGMDMLDIQTTYNNGCNVL